MTPACPGGSTGRSRAPLRVPLESASLRAEAIYGLPGQAFAGAEHRLIVTDTVAQFSVAPADQFWMSLDSPNAEPALTIRTGPVRSRGARATDAAGQKFAAVPAAATVLHSKPPP